MGTASHLHIDVPNRSQSSGAKQVKRSASYTAREEREAYWFLNGLYEILAGAEDTGGRQVVMEITVPGNMPMASPPHIHDCAETLVLLEGSVRMHVENRVIEAKAGDHFYFPAGTLEWCEASSAAPARMLLVYDKAGMDSFFREVGTPAGARTLPPRDDSPPDIERLLKVAARHGVEIHIPAEH